MRCEIHVAWPSGNGISLTIPQSSTVGDLKILAQESLGKGLLKLVTAAGTPSVT